MPATLNRNIRYCSVHILPLTSGRIVIPGSTLSVLHHQQMIFVVIAVAMSAMISMTLQHKPGGKRLVSHSINAD